MNSAKSKGNRGAAFPMFENEALKREEELSRRSKHFPPKSNPLSGSRFRDQDQSVRFVKANKQIFPFSSSRIEDLKREDRSSEFSMKARSSHLKPSGLSDPRHFIFPPQDFQLLKWNSAEEIKEYLDKGMEAFGSDFGGKVYLQKAHFGQVVFKCRICESRLTFSKAMGYKLIRFENRHRHEKADLGVKDENYEIYQYVNAIPFCQGIFMNNDFRMVIQERFKLHKEKAKTISEKIMKNFMDLDFIIEKLSKEFQIEFKKFINEQQRETSAVLIVTREMKERYQKYGKGDALVIDLRKRILTNVNQNGKLWQTLFFFGQDLDMNIVIYGACLIADRSSQMYEKILEEFIEIMGGVGPATIITKDIPALIEGTLAFDEKLPEQKKISYMCDWRGKLRKVREQLRVKKYSEEEIKSMIAWFGQLLQQPSYQRFDSILLQNKIHKIDDEIIKDFLDNKERSCLSQFPKKMCGFAPSTVRNDMYNEMILKYFKPGQNFAKFFFNLLKCQAESIAAERDYTSPLSKKNRYEELERILGRVYGRLGDKIIENYSPVVDMDSHKIEETHYQVSYNECTEDLKYEAGLWSCTCAYYDKVGIPCMHQLKIIGRNSNLIARYVKARWIRQLPKVEQNLGEEPEPDSVLDAEADPLKRETKKEDARKIKHDENTMQIEVENQEPIAAPVEGDIKGE